MICELKGTVSIYTISVNIFLGLNGTLNSSIGIETSIMNIITHV